MPADRFTALFVTTLVSGLILFLGYYFLTVSRPGKKEIRALSLQRLTGFLLLGVVPLIILWLLFGQPPQRFGLGLEFLNRPPWWTYFILPLIVAAAFASAGSESNLAMYPQIRVKRWTPSLIGWSALTWILYLVGYEFLFRGFLLYSFIGVLEPLWAIALNCALYALAHFYKGWREVIGAIPLGIFLCWLTLHTGNIWSALVIHSVMALSNEWFSIRAHPEMEVKGIR